MKRIPVQITVFPLAEVSSGDEAALRLGRRFSEAHQLPPPERILRREREKPAFDPAPPYFSISHSGAFWTCAVAAVPLGIDLQRHQPCRQERIARRFFHPAEAAWLEGRPTADFFTIWTAKESYVKFTGTGIDDQFSSFSVVGTDGRISCCRGAVLRHLPFLPDYTLCLCTPENAEVQLEYHENETIKEGLLQ